MSMIDRVSLVSVPSSGGGGTTETTNNVEEGAAGATGSALPTPPTAVGLARESSEGKVRNVQMRVVKVKRSADEMENGVDDL